MHAPRGVRLLLVEDNPGDADLIDAYLERHPYLRPVIGRAESVAEAIELAGNGFDPELALLDLTLPDSNGLETLDRLRAVVPDLPIVLLTGVQDEELVLAAIQRGAADYLAKDELTPDLLARSIRYTLDRAETARAMRRREQWFRALAENVTDLVLTTDADGIIRYVGPSQEEILGYEAEAVQDSAVLDWVHPEDRAAAAAGLRAVTEQGGAVEFQLRARSADGEWRVVSGDARNLLDEPAVEGIVITGRDVTEAVEREALLARHAADLTERVKEQRCLRRVLSILHDASEERLEAAFDEIVRAIPPGFQHPDTTAARLVLGDREWRTPGYRETDRVLRREVRGPDGEGGGVLEVVRTALERGEAEPFIPEELPLVDAIGDAIAGALDRANAYTELRRREAYFRSITEHSTDILAILDPELRPRYVSSSGRELLGSAIESDDGEGSVFDYVHPADIDPLREQLARLIDQPGGVVRSEVRVRLNGDLRTLEFAARNLLDDPDIEGLVVNARDITDRRRTELRYRTLFETMSQGVVYQNGEGAIISANPAAERILGLTLDQMKGRTSAHPEWRAMKGDGSPFPGEEHPAMVALRTGEPVNDALMGVYNPLDDRTRWIRVEARPQFRPGESEPYQVYSTFVDVTERVIGERELHRKDAILESVSVAAERFLEGGTLEGVADGVLQTLGRATTVDSVGLWEISAGERGGYTATLVHAWNDGLDGADRPGDSKPLPAESDRMTELRAGRVAHGTVSELSPEERKPLEDAGIRTVALVPVIVREELWGILRFAHHTREASWSALEIDALRAAGAILGAAIQRRADEATLRERDQELLRVQKMEAIGRLAGGIAHDFNNLLTAIGGNASFVAEQLADRLEIHADVEEIRNAADRGGRLTKQLLAFSRQQVVEERVLDPGKAASQIEPMLTRLIGEHIRLKTRLADDRYLTYMDPSQLEQILMNLVLNARDALEDGGEIHIEVDGVTVDHRHAPLGPDGPEPGAYTRIQVRDTGIGMDATTRERVFEPFFTTKAPDRGTGLGLSTVYGIVQRAGGHVELESEPGRGTTVVILLPAAEGKVDAVEEERESRARVSVTGTVLVVEDETAVRAVAVRSLEKRGFTVYQAEDGRAAMKMLAENGIRPIDVLLSDVVMPEVGGLELATWLRSRYPEMKVILTSGYTQDELVQTEIDDRKMAFIAKPYTPAQLVSKVSAVLSEN